MPEKSYAFLVEYILSLCENRTQQLLIAIERFILKEISMETLLLICPRKPAEMLGEILSVTDSPIPNPVDSKKVRSWTKTEDVRLLAGMLRFGQESWTSIANFVGNSRNRAQCSQRWNRGLNPRISKEIWLPEEDIYLYQLVQAFGSKSWTKISSRMNHRSDVQCRYRWNLLKNRFQTPIRPVSNPEPVQPQSHLHQLIQMPPQLAPQFSNEIPKFHVESNHRLTRTNFNPKLYSVF
uniref:Myb-like DNA-binding domain containing protein n=1 Tax=Coptotermes formosanus TaxID=36987 RepID=R4UMV1_COPFO|nr:Myb-like DNA-binding domain containing protein [Coptotermes formosanus]